MIGIYLVAIAVTALLLLYFFPEATERWVRRVMLARKVVFGILAIVLALFLLATGAATLMLLGGAIILLGLLWVLTDPNDEFGHSFNWE